jgi:Xaa-Pro aminopeptidase
LTDRDFILIDAGGTFKGYVADVTRVSRSVALHMSYTWLNSIDLHQTFALKNTQLSFKQMQLWHTVHSAQGAALDAAVKHGATGHSIDEAARKLIRDRGSSAEEKNGLTHRLGEQGCPVS